MKNLRRGLAVLLMAATLWTLPGVAYMEEEPEEDTSVQESAPDVSDQQDRETISTAEDVFPKPVVTPIKPPSSTPSTSPGITARDETGSNDDTGKHTIAQEFRESEKETPKKITSGSETKPVIKPSTESKPTVQSSTNSGSDKSLSTQSNTITPTASVPASDNVPTVLIPISDLPYVDIRTADWFFEDVTWAFDEGLMTGVTGGSFCPDMPVTQAMAVTVLARLAKVDLTEFSDIDDEIIPSGQWYTAAAIWAKQSGLLPTSNSFDGKESISREQVAVMLVRYLQIKDKSTELPADPIVFADSAQMSTEGNESFQILYRYNIFQSTGSNCMDPAGSATRAQFAALIHRLADTISEAE